MYYKVINKRKKQVIAASIPFSKQKNTTLKYYYVSRYGAPRNTISAGHPTKGTSEKTSAPPTTKAHSQAHTPRAATTDYRCFQRIDCSTRAKPPLFPDPRTVKLLNQAPHTVDTIVMYAMKTFNSTHWRQPPFPPLAGTRYMTYTKLTAIPSSLLYTRRSNPRLLSYQVYILVCTTHKRQKLSIIKPFYVPTNSSLCTRCVGEAASPICTKQILYYKQPTYTEYTFLVL